MLKKEYLDREVNSRIKELRKDIHKGLSPEKKRDIEKAACEFLKTVHSRADFRSHATNTNDFLK